MEHASYLRQPIISPDEMIRLAKEKLPELGHVDAIVGVGLSGAMAVPMIAHALGLRMAIVRKEDDRSTHSAATQGVEGNMEVGDRWAFVDDLIETAKTFRRAVHKMNSGIYHGQFEFVGYYLYVNNAAVRRNDDWCLEWMKDQLKQAEEGL